MIQRCHKWRQKRKQYMDHRAPGDKAVPSDVPDATDATDIDATSDDDESALPDFITDMK